MFRRMSLLAVFLCLLLGVVPCSAESQATGKLVGTIGGPSGRGAVLERPQQVLVLGDRIIVIERSEPFLKVFDLDGRLRQSTGRNGAGPGEFRLIYTTAFDSRRRLLLAFDTPLGRVTHLALSDTLRFVASQALSLQVESACFMGPRLFASARASDGIIHELLGDGPELRVARGFGAASAQHPLTTNPLYQNYLVAGHLSCDASATALTLATSLTGFMHVIGAVNGAQRTVKIERFIPIDFSATGDVLSLATPKDGFYDEVIGITSRGDTRVLTVGRTDSVHTGAGDYASYREIAVDRANGQRTLPASAWRFIDSSSGRAVCYRTDPEPEIVIVNGLRCP